MQIILLLVKRYQECISLFPCIFFSSLYILMISLWTSHSHFFAFLRFPLFPAQHISSLVRSWFLSDTRPQSLFCSHPCVCLHSLLLPCSTFSSHCHTLLPSHTFLVLCLLVLLLPHCCPSTGADLWTASCTLRHWLPSPLALLLTLAPLPPASTSARSVSLLVGYMGNWFL